jgi:hypothetical protein
VTARSKARVCVRSLAEIVGSNPASDMDICLLCVLCVVGSLAHWSPIEFGVCLCDREASIMRRPWPTRSCCTMERKYASEDGLYTTNLVPEHTIKLNAVLSGTWY